MKVICISAHARHGKDQSAEFLKEIFEASGKTVLITHYADLLKYICKTFFGWNGEKDNHGRSMLQRVGTDIIGTQKPDFWVDFLIDILHFFEDDWDIVLIPDCRFPIEVSKMKHNFDTKLLRIERPNFDNGLSVEQKNHASETALDNYEYDAVIQNNGTLEELRDKLFMFANYIMSQETAKEE